MGINKIKYLTGYFPITLKKKEVLYLEAAKKEGLLGTKFTRRNLDKIGN